MLHVTDLRIHVKQAFGFYITAEMGLSFSCFWRYPVALRAVDKLLKFPKIRVSAALFD